MTDPTTKFLRALYREGRLDPDDSAARDLLATGIAYSNDPAERTAIDETLAIAGLDTVARAILAEGRDIVEVGRELSGYATEQQARAFAVGQLRAALRLMIWHRQARVIELKALAWARRDLQARVHEKRAREAIAAPNWK